MIPPRRGTIFLTPIRLLVYSAITVVDPAHVRSVCFEFYPLSSNFFNKISVPSALL